MADSNADRPFMTRLQALCLDAFARSGLSKRQFAAALGISAAHVTNVTKFKDGISLDLAERWLATSGQRLVMSLESIDDQRAAQERQQIEALIALPGDDLEKFARTASALRDADPISAEFIRQFLDAMVRAADRRTA